MAQTHGKLSGVGFLGISRWALVFAAIWFFQLILVNPMSPQSGGILEIPPYYLSIIMYAGINMILAISLNLVSGFTGQFSMGHAGFMSVGGYVAAFLSSSIRDQSPSLFASHFGQESVFIISLLSGGAVAGAVGYLVGLPSLRLKGDYLAIVTLGFGEIIRVIVLNTSAVGGARGMPNIPPLTSFGWVYSLALITAFTVWRAVHSAHGRMFLAVREDEIAAEAMGVNTTRAKVKAFVIGAFFAGVAGGLFAHYLQYLTPSAFDFNRSFEIIIMVVLGGMGSLSGSAVAAILLTVLREALRPIQEVMNSLFTSAGLGGGGSWFDPVIQILRSDLRMVLYSLLLIILMLNRPNGLFGRNEITDFIRARFKRSSA